MPSSAGHPNEHASSATGPVEHRDASTPDDRGGSEAVAMGQALVADLETLLRCVQRLTALRDLIDSALPADR